MLRKAYIGAALFLTLLAVAGCGPDPNCQPMCPNGYVRHYTANERIELILGALAVFGVAVGLVKVLDDTLGCILFVIGFGAAIAMIFMGIQGH